MNKKCVKCGAKLTSFIGYIPEVGETCIECYIEYEIKDENKVIIPAMSNKASFSNARKG